MLKIEIISPCLTSSLTQVRFRDKLNYVDHVGWQKIRPGL